MINIKIIRISSTWNHLTVCKQMSSYSFENKVTSKIFAY